MITRELLYIALVHVDSATHRASTIEAHIERGVAIATAAEYLGDKKLRILVLRPRADLPALIARPHVASPGCDPCVEPRRDGAIP